MRRLIGWTVAWTFYWLGDLASRCLHVPDSWPEWWFDFFYPIYQRLMNASWNVQEWGGGSGPWITK